MSDVDLSLRQLLASYDSASARPRQSHIQRERGMVMPGQSGRPFDIIRQIVGNVVNIFNKRASPCTAPCDGMVLKMHYQWTFWVLLGGFSSVWYCWYHRDVITCASHFNAETQVRLDYINICLSYPFVEAVANNYEEGGGIPRRYLLFYRWIHWVLLLLAGIYYIPRKISKTSENSKVKKLIEDLAVNAHRYDGLERELVDRTAKYIAYNLKTHNGLYYKYLTCNLMALLVDIFCFQFLDFVFQGRFLKYGFNAFPFSRDPQNFSDYMSDMFPPFANCELHDQVQLVNKRIERLGCHLTIMELYEKYFLALWVWLIILTSMTVSYIIFLGLMWFPWARLWMLRIAKPLSARDTIRNTICTTISSCKIGDVYLLYRLKQHFSHARYYELLTRLSDPDFLRAILDTVSIDHHNKGGGGPDLRQRKPNPKTPGKFQDALFHPPSEGGYLPNSSILVE
ncbi:innexin inx2-like isoform X1 [Macrobrachium nipponense]|uniref:innexin inx2-like isoform X1 n=1 Tax=Macrobrachium nipponense TaxID=159736 RepID=UPI0030C8BEAA